MISQESAVSVGSVHYSEENGSGRPTAAPRGNKRRGRRPEREVSAVTGNDVLLRVEDPHHPDTERAARWGRQLYQEIWIADIAPPDRVRLSQDPTDAGPDLVLESGENESSDRPQSSEVSGKRTLPGTVLVDLLSPESLAVLVRCMREWAARIERTVQIVLNGDALSVTGAWEGEEEAAVAAFLDRHLGERP
jgi:hypothetical protein